MSVQLICDFCGNVQGEKNGVAVRPHWPGHWMVEIRGITATQTSEITHSDYPHGQVHWGCLVPFVEHRNAKDQEVPF